MAMSGHGPAAPEDAPGAPGLAPTWTSSTKDLVTTANEGASRLWATLGFGIVNEVYWPSTGEPQVRDLGFVIGFDDGRWVEVKRAHAYTVSTPRPYVPLANIVHEGSGYRLVLEVVPDPLRDALLIGWHLQGAGRLHVLLAPHLGSSGWDNTAWVADELFASRRHHHLCLASNHGFVRGSAGYVGASDGWQDFARHGRMNWTFPRAARGNVALTGELAGSRGLLALAFSDQVEGARLLALAAVAEDLPSIRGAFERGWRGWGETLRIPDAPPDLARQAQLSAAVLKMHEDRTYPGAVVASLSIPWGNRSNDLGGYHLVWTRDAVEAGLGLLAVGKARDAARMLSYLVASQEPDGRWPQNQFSFGRPYWTGIQLDQVGFPVIFAAKLLELGTIERSLAVERMVRSAASFLARHGPLSPQDRWEENAGVSPFTLGVEVAALVAAAEFVDADEDAYLLSLADYWNERIETWTFVEHGPLSGDRGGGYYVRLVPATGEGGPKSRIEVRNRIGTAVEAVAMVGLDFLYLVRLGLRRPDDARVRSSLEVAERTLRVETPSGPAFRRYNLDGYGEHEDGAPYDGTGVGRAWPLLTGERGHHEVAAGGDALPYLEAMARMTGPGGLLPEQVWDADPIPGRYLLPGKPTGAAMPLVWAHAEFVKLLVARETGRPLEMLEAVRARYDGLRPRAKTWHWRRQAPFGHLPQGRDLLIEGQRPFMLHVGFDGWAQLADRPSKPLPFGELGVRIPHAELAGHATLEFTVYDLGTRTWSGVDHRITLAE
jgi:glucoamylase